MPFFVFFLIFFGIMGNGIKKLVDKVKRGGVGELFTSPFFIIGSTILTSGGLLFPLIILAIIFSNAKKNPKNQNRNPYFQPHAGERPQYQYSFQNGAAQQQTPPPVDMRTGNPVSQTAFGLPASPRKRKKIVRKFNEKYVLNLSEQDIDNLVGGSFMNAQWAREICYMNQEYPTVHSWYSTAHPWLKAYLSAFNQLNISPDFETQAKIVYDSFEQIFDDILTDPHQTVNEAISRINYKYLTNFDEATFAIALRYMESMGKSYKVNFAPIQNSNAEIDDLLQKYSNNGNQMPSH